MATQKSFTSTNPKMGGAAIKSYEKGGMVTKPQPKGFGGLTAEDTARIRKETGLPENLDPGPGKGRMGPPRWAPLLVIPGAKPQPKERGIYTAEMGQPPQDIDGGSAPRKPTKPAPKKK